MRIRIFAIHAAVGLLALLLPREVPAQPGLNATPVQERPITRF
jgi:hypothetical protein